jgi:hypothetical protein
VSRLDSAIRRLEAQRDCLAYAAGLIDDLNGNVLELGLGNGRTYDHLRDLMPDREIFVFDRKIAAHPDCIPDDEHAILGDFSETLPATFRRLGAATALAHCDTGSGDSEATRAQAAWLGPAVDPLLTPGALVLSDQRLRVTGWADINIPESVAPGRYYMYRKTS